MLEEDKVNSSIELDDYAVEILKPRRAAEQEQYNDEISEVKTSLLNEKMNLSKLKADLEAEVEKRRNAETEITELKDKLKSLESVLADKEKVINDLTEKCKKYESEITELRKSQKRKLF